MIDKRKNFAARTQYDILEKCLYNCKGNNKCDLYKEYNGSCVWYESLVNDISKLKEGSKKLTFPILEKILENNEIKPIKTRMSDNEKELFRSKIKEYVNTPMYKQILSLDNSNLNNSKVTANKIAQEYAMQFVRERRENMDTIRYIGTLR